MQTSSKLQYVICVWQIDNLSWTHATYLRTTDTHIDWNRSKQGLRGAIGAQRAYFHIGDGRTDL